MKGKVRNLTDEEKRRIRIMHLNNMLLMQSQRAVVGGIGSSTPTPPDPPQPVYIPQALQVFARMNTQPSENDKIAMNKFIASQVASGNWDNIITFKCLVDSNPLNALVDWKGLMNATLGGATPPTFNPASGFETDGVQNFIKWGLIPSTHLTKNDNIVGSYLFKNIKVAGVTNPMLFGASKDTLRRLRLFQGTGITYQNWDTIVSAYLPGDSLGLLDNNLYSVRRSDASNKQLFINSTQVATDAVAAQSDSALLDYEIYGGAQNGTTVNVATNFYDARIGAFFAAKPSAFNLDNFYQNLIVYYQDKGIYFRESLVNSGTIPPGGGTHIKGLIIGDSIASSTSNAAGSAVANTLYEYVNSSLNLVAAGSDITGANIGGPYPAMAAALFTAKGRPLDIVEMAVGGANFEQERDSNNWSIKGANLAPMAAAAQSYLVSQNAQRFDFIEIICGLNSARGTALISDISTAANELIRMLKVMFPGTPIIMSNIHSKSPAPAQRVIDVRNIISTIIANNPGVVYAGKDLDDFQASDFYDLLHLNQPANVVLGQAQAAIIGSII